MKRSIVLPVAGALALIPAALGLAAFQSAPPQACPNVFPHEPLVVYEVRGYGFGGLFDLQLTVHNDGTARLARAEADGAPGACRVTYVGQDAAVDLARSLAQLGAQSECDQQIIVNDLPLSTLTVLGAGTDARAHTYSWLLPTTQATQTIELRLQGFVATWFPGV